MFDWIILIVVLAMSILIATSDGLYPTGVVFGITATLFIGLSIWLFVNNCPGALGGKIIMRYLTSMMVMWGGLLIGGVIHAF